MSKKLKWCRFWISMTYVTTIILIIMCLSNGIDIDIDKTNTLSTIGFVLEFIASLVCAALLYRLTQYMEENDAKENIEKYLLLISKIYIISGILSSILSTIGSSINTNSFFLNIRTYNIVLGIIFYVIYEIICSLYENFSHKSNNTETDTNESIS